MIRFGFGDFKASLHDMTLFDKVFKRIVGEMNVCIRNNMRMRCGGEIR